MNTRRAASPVSLFPFLAVLVCAMGALIFLLLVVTRQIRAEVRAEATQDVRPETVAETLLSPTQASESPVPFSMIDDVPPVVVDWGRMLDELTARHRDDVRALAETRRAVRQAELREAEIETELRRIQETGEDHATQRGALASRLKRLRDRAETLRRDLERQQREIRERKAKAASVESRYAFLPFDSVDGTRRRPIFIECHPDRIEFASEKIGLTAKDLDGYTRQANPLLAGVRALVGFWSTRKSERTGDQNTGVEEPYVLMVVRPGGIHAYYIARKLLRQLETPIGYELVPEKMPLAWPAYDAAAAAACREAVDQAVAHRQGAGSDLAGQERGGGFGRHRRALLPRRGSVGPRGSTGRSSAAAVRSGLTDEEKSVEAVGRRNPPTGVERSEGGGRRNGAERIDPKTRGEDGAALVDGGGRSQATGEKRTGSGSVRNRSEVSTFESLSVGGTSSDAGSSRGSGRGTDGSPRQWGIASLGATIGYERRVDVRVEQNRVTVVGQPRIDVVTNNRDELSVDDLRRRVIRGVQRTARSWGQPPERFYWVPAIRFEVSPGGALHYERLNSLFRSWRLATSVDYVLPTVPEPASRLIEEPAP